MPFDIDAARKDGYSDADISSYLAEKSNFDITSAKKDGYTDTEIIQHLVSKPAKKAEPTSQKGPTILPESDTSSDFIRGITNLPGQLQSTYGGMKALTGLAAQKLGAAETGKSLLKSGVESMNEGESRTTAKESDEFTKAWEKGIGTVITDWLPYQVGSGVGSLIETLGFMGVGAGVGAVTGAGVGALPGAVASALAKKGVKELAREVAKKEGKDAAEAFVQAETKKVLISAGKTAGMVGQAGMHGAGEVTGRAIQEAEQRGGVAEDVNLARVIPAAIVHGVADFVANKIGLDALKISDKASKSFIAEISKNVALTAGKEIPPETLQSIAERYGAELSLTDAEAFSEYLNTVAAAVGMSVGPGTVGGARSAAQARGLDSLKQKIESVSESPIVATTTVDVDGKKSEKITRKDGSVEIDGVQVIAPTQTDTADTTTAETTNDTDLDAALKGFAPATTTTFPTSLATMRPGQQVTLYRGENAENEENGQWWTTDKAKAEKFGKVTEITLPAETIGKHAAMGHNSPNEFVFPNKKPTELAQVKDITPRVEFKELKPATDLTPEEIDRAKKAFEIAQNLKPPARPHASFGVALKNLGISVEGGKGFSTRAKDAIAQRLADIKGAPSGTTVNTTTDRTSTDVAKPADTNVSTEGVTTPADGGLGTDGNVSTAPSARKGTPPAPLAPQIVEHIQELRDKVSQLANDGKGRKLNGTRSIDKPYTRAVNAYNAAKKQYDESGGNLSATYRNIQELIDVGEQAYVSGLREDLPATEKEETTDFETNLKESYKGKESGYEQENLYPTAQEDYEDELVANNVEVAKHNENHAALVKAQKDARKEYNDATKTLQEYEETAEDSDQFDTVVARVEEQIAQLKQQVDIANEALQNYGRERTQLPIWGKLERDEKDVYFSHIKPNSSIEERQKAARVLQAYRADKVARGLHKEESGKVRVINGYSEDKDYYSKFFNLAFPQWESLSKAAQDIYIKTLSRTDTNAKTGKTNTVYINAGIQKPLAFARVGVQVLTEARGQVKEETQKAAATRAELQKTISDISIAQQERDKQLREDQQRGMPSPVKAIWLPSKIVKILSPTIEAPYGNLQGVLNYMRNLPKSNQHVDILRAIAQSLYDLKLNTKIKLVDKLSKKDLAQYSPETDTVYLTKKGFTVSTVLHELVHAATVRIISMYEYVDNNKKSPTYGQHTQRNKLTAEQIRGVENLKAIMEETRDFLSIGGKDPAFKNLLEFVAYSLTDASLQNGLRDFSPSYAMLSKLGMAKKEIVASKTSVWSELLKTIAEILGISSKPQVKNNVNKPNFLFETIAAFNDIMSVPTEPIFLGRLSAAKKPTDEETTGRMLENYLVPREQRGRTAAEMAKYVSTVPGWKRLAAVFQNDSYEIRDWENQNALAKLIRRTGSTLNNIYEQITLSSGIARNLYNENVSELARELNATIAKYAEVSGQTTDPALAKLHMYMEALHEPERRLIQYLLNVPLNDDKKNLTFMGKQMSAAEVRDSIVGLLNTKNMTKANAETLRGVLNSLVFQKDASGGIIYKDGMPQPNMTYVDAMGKSRSDKKATDITNAEYNVTGLPLKSDKFLSIEGVTNEYNNDPHKAEIDAVREVIQKLHKATTKLNKIANYWSQPVSNRVAFYGWENYIPLKGKARNPSVDDFELDFDTRAGRDLQSAPAEMGGRGSVADNPVLRTLADATNAALNAGRKDLTLSVKNSLPRDKEKNPNGQGLLEGRVKTVIKFDDPQRDNLIKENKGDINIFHYEPNGDISVLVVANEAKRNAIRKTFKDVNPFVQFANNITSMIGQLHTRYNFNFAPMNFARDILTNAFVMGAEMGPVKAAKFIQAVSAQVVLQKGMYKAMKVAVLMSDGSKKSWDKLRTLAKEDAYYQTLIEYVVKGGMVAYLKGLGLKSNFQDLNEEIGKNGIVKTKEQVDKVLDIWTNMFELASRAAAYGIIRDEAYQKNLKDNMEKKLAMDEASVEAAAYVKNLANFEQVGEAGKLMGAFFMYFRQAATGAVRSIEALAPAFPGAYDRAILRLPKHIKDNPKALAEFEKAYKEQETYARQMVGILTALGMLGYFLALGTADDDDLGRNAVATDNMQQWTRYLRFHVPKGITEAIGLKEPIVWQIPWGFGFGAFAAAGAQIAAMGNGTQNIKDGLGNIFLSIAMDSFIPIPISKMPPTEMPLEFIVDSLTPSVVRPVVEFMINKNGLGQAIYNDQNRRMGDAYTGGDRIPEIYKNLAAYLAEEGVFGFGKLGGIDPSPNTLYFLSNSYLDGVARLVETFDGVYNMSQNKKDFIPKNDLPLMGSFFGAKSNVDSREFTKVEDQIKAMERRLNMFKSNPILRAEYEAENPFDAIIVHTYNHDINGRLKRLHEEANKIRRDRELDSQYKLDRLKINVMEQNIIKRNLIDKFEAYDVKP